MRLLHIALQCCAYFVIAARKMLWKNQDCCIFATQKRTHEGMKITPKMRKAVRQGIRSQHLKGNKINNTKLSSMLGKDRSWATRFFNGKLRTIDEDDIRILEDQLEIRILTVEFPTTHSPIAEQVARLIDQEPHVREIAEILLQIRSDASLPWFSPSQLEKIGSKIIRLAHADPNKAGKVGAEFVSWFELFIEKVASELPDDRLNSPPVSLSAQDKGAARKSVKVVEDRTRKGKDSPKIP